jgi:hypothetical protein
MTLRKPLSTGLALVLLAATWTPLYAARTRRTSVSSNSRSAVSKTRKSSTAYRGKSSSAYRGGSATHTRRATGVSTASRSAVHHSTVVHSRSYSHRNVVVYRPHGAYYHGYGSYHNDDDAWKWLAFTAITLKILDNMNEEQQRQHEAAQVEATTAPVGQPITWNDGSASGSVTTTRQGTDAGGNQCREFQQEVTIGGETEDAYGTACLQPDGSWKIQE